MSVKTCQNCGGPIDHEMDEIEWTHTETCAAECDLAEPHGAYAEPKDESEDEVEIKERSGPPTTGASLDRFLEDQPNPSPVRKMLDLSTVHMPESSPDWGEVRVVEHEHGFIVFVSSEEAEAGVPAWLVPIGVPEWLGSIWKLAAVEECMLINFDQDAEKYEQFKTYDW